MLIGSSVKAGSGYLGDDGEWFEEDHPEDVSRVVSSHLCHGPPSRGTPWTYTGGAIINSTITIGGEEIFFLKAGIQRYLRLHGQTDSRNTDRSPTCVPGSQKRTALLGTRA